MRRKEGEGEGEGERKIGRRKTEEFVNKINTLTVHS